MRGNDGKPVKNCHLLGTLKRVARLLYHNIRPVFVFDGAAPALKLQTIQARQQRRRDADLNVEQSARRILAARMHRLIFSSNTTTTTNAAQQENINDEGTYEEKGSENETTTTNCNYYQKKNSSSQVVHMNGGVVSLENLEDDDGPRVDTSSTAGNNRTTQQDDDDEIQWQPGDTNEMEEEKEESMMDDYDDILLPEGDSVDVSVIAALPVHMRKKVIEKAQRNERMRSRRVYMPLAADPQRFCDAQIQNLIRGSDLNRQIRNLQEKNVQKITSDIKETERSIASDETRKFMVTTESSNVKGSTQVPPVEDRLGTYEGFEQWMYQSSDEEEDIKYGEDRMDKQETSSSTMKIKQEEKKSTIIKHDNTHNNKSQTNINNRKRTRRYDDGAGGGFLPNMSDAALDSTIERRTVVLEEDKHINTIYDGGFIVDSSIKPDVVVTTKNMKKVSSSSIYKMGSSEEEGGGGMNVVTVLGGNEHDDVAVQQYSSSSSNVITPLPITKVNEVKSQERQQDTQNHPSQCDDTGFELDNNNSSLSHAAAAGSSTSKTTIGFSSTLQQEEEEDHRATTATLEQQQQQQGQTRAENNSPKIDVAANFNQDEEEINIYDIELEANPENINFSSSSFDCLVDTNSPSPSFQQQPVLLPADEGGYKEVDKVIEQSSEILGNMPDYVKRQFERHVKEYRNKMLPPPLSSSMDEQRENSDKIHGSSLGGGGIILEEDEWEDGMKNQEMGIDDDNLSIIAKGSTEEDHVGSYSFNNIKRGGGAVTGYGGSTAPFTIVSSQCKSEEGGSSFKIGNNVPPLPLTSSTRTSSSNSNNIESLVDEKPEVLFGGIETTMMTQALNVKENSTNNNDLVVVNTTYQVMRDYTTTMCWHV